MKFFLRERRTHIENRKKAESKKPELQRFTLQLSVSRTTLTRDNPF